jgi:hypothetical protein
MARGIVYNNIFALSDMIVHNTKLGCQVRDIDLRIISKKDLEKALQ